MGQLTFFEQAPEDVTVYCSDNAVCVTFAVKLDKSGVKSAIRALWTSDTRQVAVDRAVNAASENTTILVYPKQATLIQPVYTASRERAQRWIRDYTAWQANQPTSVVQGRLF